MPEVAKVTNAKNNQSETTINNNESTAQVEETSLAKDANFEKTKKAGEALNETILELVEKIKGGERNIYDLCRSTDESLQKKLSQQFLKLPKGSAFPTCISCGKIASSYTPKSRQESLQIDENLPIKIECAAHIDSFVTNITHTLYLNAETGEKINDTTADSKLPPKPLIVLHFIKLLSNSHLMPNMKASDLINRCNEIAKTFNCQIISNVECYTLSKNPDLHQEKVFSLNPNSESRKMSNAVNFELNDYISFEVLVTENNEDSSRTGQAPTIVADQLLEPTIYKLNSYYQSFKLNQEKLVYNDLNKKFGKQYFSIRDLFTDSKSQFGWQALKKQIEEVPVYSSSDSNHVYALRQSILIRRKKPVIMAGLAVDLGNNAFTHQQLGFDKLPQEIQDLIKPNL